MSPEALFSVGAGSPSHLAEDTKDNEELILQRKCTDGPRVRSLPPGLSDGFSKFKKRHCLQKGDF